MKIKLKEYLDQRDISLLRFCKRTGICYKTVNRWTLGRTNRLSADIIEKICYALDCSVDDIVEFEIPKHLDDIQKLQL